LTGAQYLKKVQSRVATTTATKIRTEPTMTHNSQAGTGIPT
jgi:hypothetical protein